MNGMRGAGIVVLVVAAVAVFLVATRRSTAPADAAFISTGADSTGHPSRLAPSGLAHGDSAQENRGARVPADSEPATADAAPGSGSSAAPTRGSLVVDVVVPAAFDGRISELRVDLFEPDGSSWEAVGLSTRLGDDGSVRFSDLAPGSYLPVVVGESLPAGLAEPLMPIGYALPGPGVEYRYEVVEVSGGEARHELRLEPTSTLRVHQPSDSTGGWIRVELLWSSIQNANWDADLGPRGVAEFEGLPPGPYRCTFVPVELAGVAADPHRRYSPSLPTRPQPIDLTLGIGVVEDVYFDALDGPYTLRGRVVYGDGRPAARLEVRSYYVVDDVPPSQKPLGLSDICRRVRTGSDGRFELRGVPEATVAVQIEPDGFSPRRPADQNRLASHSGRWVVDTASAVGPVVELGDLVVERSRPCVVRGTIVSDRLTAGDDGLDESDLSLDVWLEPPSPPSGKIRSRGRIEVDAEMSFETVLEQRYGTVWIEANYHGSSGGPWVTPVEIEGQESVDLGAITIP